MGGVVASPAPPIWIMGSVFDDLMSDGAAALEETLGQSVTHTASGASSGTATTGIVYREPSMIETGEDGSGLLERCRVRIRNDATAGISAAAVGDTVTVDGDVWHVKQVHETASFLTLECQRWTQDQKRNSRGWLER